MDNLQPLTDRQGQVLDAIIRSLDERGFPPTLRELAEVLDVSGTNAVSEHLAALQRKGWLTREYGVSRGIRLSGGARARRRAAVVVA